MNCKKVLSRPNGIELINSLKHTVPGLASRFEYPFARLYATDLEALLDEMIRIEQDHLIDQIHAMDDHIYQKLITTPTEETFRTVYSVAKSLPHAKEGGGYRYKVHYTNSANVKKKIGVDSLEAIAFHLHQTTDIRWAGDSDSVRFPFSTWGSCYFYCKNLDWLPVITLIDGRFISKIEIITLESEVER